jgi:hypothetical protein
LLLIILSYNSFCSASFLAYSKVIVDVESSEVVCSFVRTSFRSLLVSNFVELIPAFALGQSVNNQATHKVSNFLFIMFVVV